MVIRRRTDEGRWDDVTAAQFRDEVAALAKGLIAAGISPGDRVALMSQDPVRVDPDRLRDLGRRCRDGPHLRNLVRL